ncbi:HAMP domain-containing sensor histidine kinase [Bacillus subtilis]|nr:HAMP domain-containing sensor histidine kinase [Bacillus subtilis]MDM5300294.1 HAMP domain-containing sensor histidine kinase [Bacillus subtilis]MDM5322347.1 HAMP domain-containing sensor histidine kinase [Bacillus subtilis]
MNVKKRFTTHYIIVLLIMFGILTLTSLTLSPLSMVLVHAALHIKFGSNFLLAIISFIIPIFIVFIVLSLYYSMKISNIILYFLDWINDLTNADYESLINRDKPLKQTKLFNLFTDLKCNLEKLTYRLQENELERSKIDNMRKDWTAGVTHDLKTPLSYIQGYSTMLLSQKESYSEAEKEEMLRITLEKSIHMKELIDDLNSVFQFEKGDIPYKPKRGNIISFLKDNVDDIQKQPRALNYHLSFHSNINTFECQFDENLLKRALSNLLVNAIIHNPENTKIILTVSINETNQRISINIKDFGVGMTREELDRLFETYYRGTSTEFSTEGTGLGMAITKQLIETHGGDISVTSIKGAETSILVELPIT